MDYNNVSDTPQQRPRLTSRGSSASIRRSTSRLRTLASPASAFGTPRVHSSTKLDSDPGPPSIDVSLDNTLPRDYFLQDILSVLKQLRIFKWRKISKDDYHLIRIDRISGALTNCVYKVTYKDYYPLLLRLYGDVENIIDRQTELDTLRRLSQKNIGPRLLGCFHNGRFEEFLNNSITLNKYHIRDAKISRMIARRMKELHKGISLTNDERFKGPKVWILIEKWIKIIDNFVEGTTEREQQEVFFLNWEQFKALIGNYKTWLFNQYLNQNINDLLTFCHNDTQYGNILFYDKSQRVKLEDEDDITMLNLNSSIDELSIDSSATSSLKDELKPIVTDLNFPFDTRLTVIDFEYAGANLPAYDITNHFMEWMNDYHDAANSYKTDESKYPTKEQRLNLLNSYVKYVPGSSTPSLGPMYKLDMKPSSNNGSATPTVSILPTDLPPEVTKLYNETIIWRASCSIFWSLWGILSKGSLTDKIPDIKTEAETKFEYGPNGEQYTITEIPPDSTTSNIDVEDNNIDDDFDYLKYSNGKIAVAIGDLIQFGLLQLDDIDINYQQKIKSLDCQMIFK